MVCVLLQETASPLTFIMNVISVNFIACFRIMCLFLQILNYRGNEKYVLVLVPCHDGIITNSINLFGVLHESKIYLVRDHRIMTLDSNQNLIFLIITNYRQHNATIYYPVYWEQNYLDRDLDYNLDQEILSRVNTDYGLQSG